MELGRKTNATATTNSSRNSSTSNTQTADNQLSVLEGGLVSERAKEAPMDGDASNGGDRTSIKALSSFRHRPSKFASSVRWSESAFRGETTAGGRRSSLVRSLSDTLLEQKSSRGFLLAGRDSIDSEEIEDSDKDLHSWSTKSLRARYITNYVSERVDKMSEEAYSKIFGENYNRKEATFVVIAGALVALNMGFVNGAVLSGFLLPTGETQSVSGYSSTFTRSALAMVTGNWERFGYYSCLILSYMMGSLIAGAMSPYATPYQLEPSYGPTFLIGGGFMIAAALLSAIRAEGQYIFYLCCAANGIQNGIASIYSANLIRCSLTGSVTDIALTIGQMLRGNYSKTWRAWILAIIVFNFWLGGIVSYNFVKRFESYTLMFSAGLFVLIGLSLAYFLVVEIGVSVQAAILGTWKWKRILKKINNRLLLSEDTSGPLTEVALLQLFDRIDDDGNGEIDADELLEALVAADVKMSAFEIRTLFRAADQNHDGVISKAEWTDLTNKLTKKNG